MENFPEHIKNIIKNREEILLLHSMHGRLAGKSRGKKHNVEVLNKSAIVLLVACWEAYVEDLAEIAFEFLLTNLNEPTNFPAKVLSLASKELVKDEDKTKIWQLAGDGWMKVLEAHKDKVKERYIGKLNTPRPKQIDELFECLIGVRGLSAKWYWQGASNEKVLQRLDKLITTRGEIAHRVATSKSVRKVEVEKNVNFLGNLSVKLSNQVGQYLTDATGKEPWITMRYGKVS